MSQKIKAILSKIAPVDRRLEAAIWRKLDNLTKPRRSLGRLEELAAWYSLIHHTLTPSVVHKVAVVMAGDHGVAAEGVSAFPQEVTKQMALNFLAGGAGISALAKHTGTRVVVVDVGVAGEALSHPELRRYKVAQGTRNMAVGPAMTRKQAQQALEVGIRVVEEELATGVDIIATGDMGIANTTPSSALTAVFTGCSVDEVSGPGTGIDQETLSYKKKVIKQAIAINKPQRDDPWDVLAKLGGLEIAGLAGVILAGAAYRRPIVLDGFISGAAALVAYQIKPQILDYLLAAHLSREAGHRVILEHLGLNPLLRLDLRLGEGTGAVLGINLVEAGVKIMTQMASFSKAGVSETL